MQRDDTPVLAVLRRSVCGPQMRWLALAVATVAATAAATASGQQMAPYQNAPQTVTPDADPSADTGTVAGRISAETTGKNLSGTQVTLVDLRRRVETAADGSFRFERVPPGDHLLRAAGPAGRALTRVTVEAGKLTTVDLAVDIAVMDEMVVSAGPGARSQLETAQPTSVLSGEELVLRREGTLGETLDDQPGVSSTSFGPGASRPVIRGLGGERIRTLQGGIGSADASNSSPDHAVSVDPLSAERIEILRGPATLLYGSSAVGGVVNVLDARIPDYVPEQPVSGQAEIGGGTAADQRSGAVSLTGGAGTFAWHADYSRRDADDVEVPDEARDEDGESLGGILENSAVETDSGSVGVSWVTERGYFGVSASGFDTLYGVPGHAHGHGHEDDEHGEDDHHDEGSMHAAVEDDEHDDHGEEGEEEEDIRIDLEQRRFDLRGEYLLGGGFVEGVKVRFGVADYEHVELEGDEVGTRFLNDSWEGRLELVQRRRGDWDGSLGLQASSSDFSAIGEEAFVPPSVTDSLAVFAFQELEKGPLTWQFGLRWEAQDVDPEGALPRRSFDGVSGSLGLVWELAGDSSLTASLSRTERLPTATELFADGPHAATRAFEIGDPDLDPETSLGFDLSLKTGSERVSGAVNLFVNRFDGFIYEAFTGLQEDGLEVVRFVQEDAEFLGAEVDLLWRLAEVGGGHFDLRTRADYVRAELDDGSALPRITPLRLGLGLSYHRGPWHGLVEVRRVQEQDRVGEEETPTDGYTLLNAALTYRLFVGEVVTDVVLRGSNLTDELARNHVSFLKEEAPLPGRDLSLILRLAF